MHVWHLGDIPGAWSVPDLPWCLGWNNGTKHPVAVARWILWDMWGPGSTPRKSHHVQWTRLCLGWVRSTGAKNKPSPMGPMGYETGTTLHPWSINHHPSTMFDAYKLCFTHFRLHSVLESKGEMRWSRRVCNTASQHQHILHHVHILMWQRPDTRILIPYYHHHEKKLMTSGRHSPAAFALPGTVWFDPLGRISLAKHQIGG